MMKLGLFTAAVAISTTALACSSGPEERQAAREEARTSGDEITVSGCLTSASDGRAVLTAAPDQGVATAARAATGVRDTHSYVLIGGDNLQAHIGRQVEVTGRLAEGSDQVEHQASTESAPATTDPGAAPRTSTTERVDIQLRELIVSSTREVSPKCVLNP